MTNTSLAKDKINILLLEGIHPIAKQTFIEAGYHRIREVSSAVEDDELVEHFKTTHILGIRSRTLLTPKLLSQADKLLAVGCFCIGTNQVDLAYAAQQGIAVFNAPYSNTRSVAELVIGHCIILSRGIAEKNAAAHRGGWLKTASNSHEVRGKTLGIVGYGNIGSQVSVLAENLGLKVIFYDSERKLPLGNSAQVSSLEDLLQQSDIVSLHVPATDLTTDMIGKQQFSQMKTGSVLINTSRGSVINIDDLVAALQAEKIKGAALDVFPEEPQSNHDQFLSPLRDFDNVILTPHIGGSTEEAQQNIGQEVAEKLIKYSDNGSSVSSVNIPEVSLPAHAQLHRILHIHKNIPGVLSEINSLFSTHGINIVSQYLQTNNEIGYVVLDVDSSTSQLALKEISKVNGTIRARVLY